MTFHPALALDPDGPAPIPGVMYAALELASYRSVPVSLAAPLAPFIPVYAERPLYDIDLPASEWSPVTEVRC